MGSGRAIVWAGLLSVAQVMDVVTTGVDRARGAVEAVPWTASVLEVGGLSRLALLKLLLALAAATALAITLRWSRRSTSAAVVHRFVLNACRITTVVAVLASFSNAVLLSSLSN